MPIFSRPAAAPKASPAPPDGKFAALNANNPNALKTRKFPHLSYALRAFKMRAAVERVFGLQVLSASRIAGESIMSDYIHQTKYETIANEFEEPAAVRLLSGIALTLLLIVGGAILYSLTTTQTHTAQSVILNDFATLNLEAAEGRTMQAASLPSASRFE